MTDRDREIWWRMWETTTEDQHPAARDAVTHTMVLIMLRDRVSKSCLAECSRALCGHLRGDRFDRGINKHSREHAVGMPATDVILRWFDPMYGMGGNGNQIELRPKAPWYVMESEIYARAAEIKAQQLRDAGMLN